MKKHFSRYTPELVSKITGTPVEDLLEVYKTYAATGAVGKAGTIMYAMGWTQHTVGVQNIRTMAIIQLLLGNMGVAGGGVNPACRDRKVRLKGCFCSGVSLMMLRDVSGSAARASLI